MRKKHIVSGLIAVLVVAMVAGFAMAQPAGGQRGGQRGQGMRGNFDPAQMQEMMMNRLQEQLEISDTEMSAIKPLLTKVMDARRELQGGRMRGMMRGMMGRGGRGGNRGGFGQQDQAELTGLAKIQSELGDLLEAENADTAKIKAKLTEFRKAREKLQQQLATAQANLIKVLTAKQEATLVMAGQLD